MRQTRLFILLLLTGLYGIANSSFVLAQNQSAEPTELSDQFQTNNYFAERINKINKQKAANLSAIDKEYGDALKQLSAENVQRLKAALEKKTEALSALKAEGLPASDYQKESKRIDAENKQARNEIVQWRTALEKKLRDVHKRKRAAQFEITKQLIAQEKKLQQTIIQRLQQGPVILSSLPPLSLPESAVPASGDQTAAGGGVTQDSGGQTPVQGGGIDVSGTVPVDSPGDELIAQQNLERQSHFEMLFAAAVERRQEAEDEAADRVSEQQESREDRKETLAQLYQATLNQRQAVDCDDWPGGKDADGDGVFDAACGGADCDDNNPNRYPGNTEVCDAHDLDEDCDPNTFGRRDADSDGFFSSQCCNYHGGTLNCGQDCDDSKASVHPTAAEICNLIDDNCDGDIEDADDGVLATKYLDRDGDTHGDPDSSLMVCAQINRSPYADAEWLSTYGNDCDDTDPDVWRECDAQQSE